MATNLLWFVMAGFLLGFATSTLWEWFYFRKERLKLTDRRIRELEAKLRDPESAIDNKTSNSLLPTVDSVTAASTGPSRTSAWGDTTYRSPGVFLESEEYEADDNERSISGRERPLSPQAPLASVTPSPPVQGGSNFAPLTSQSKSTPNTASQATLSGTSAEINVSPPETSVVPRSEQTPADALRAKRGDSPRSRQEVLAALRRNSEAAQRGQLPRSESESASTEPPRSSLQSGDTLIPPASSASSEPPSFAPLPLPPLPLPPLQTPLPAPPIPVPSESPERKRWKNNPTLTERTKEYPDDLSKIKGIGDVYKQRLYRAGIYTWKQIAEGEIESLRRATNAYPSSNVDEWLVQAQKLMEKHGRVHAVYSGPQPDDMTKILGIGPVSASMLYRSGICTYEQLASTSIAELAELFPIAVAGDQPDFEQWVARAAALADEKHRDK